VFHAIEKDTRQHGGVRYSCCTFHSAVEVTFLAYMLNVTHGFLCITFHMQMLCIALNMHITLALFAVLGG